ncbi:hypothetical protein EYC80_004144 [Monilinia laxa]|uniref:Uncharacterized protein n=1 Tax=Monilinia laxa TaxID=61186 RepID=A0A5N6KMF3_MONLA|nr:hypothetical protein EYC80_004144 [Monilinia laxa]
MYSTYNILHTSASATTNTDPIVLFISSLYHFLGLGSFKAKIFHKLGLSFLRPKHEKKGKGAKPSSVRHPQFQYFGKDILLFTCHGNTHLMFSSTFHRSRQKTLCKFQITARAGRLHLSFPQIFIHCRSASMAGQIYITARKALDDGEVQDMQPGALYISC